MTKIEEIEDLLKQWKACKPPDEDIHGIISIKKCKGGTIALEQALAILNRPTNNTVEDVCSCATPTESWLKKRKGICIQRCSQ